MSRELTFKDMTDTIMKHKAFLSYLLIIFSITVVTVNGQANNATVSAKECRLDICFLLDVSGSIFYSNFQYVKLFVSHFVDSFEISANKTQIGVVTFGMYTYVEFGLDQYNDAVSLKTAVENITYRDESRSNLTAGLITLRSKCFGTSGDRAAVSNLAIIVSDGAPDSFSSALEQASLTRRAGIDIVAVAVGTSINITLLAAIANGPQNVFVREDYTELAEDIVENIKALSCAASKKACTPDSEGAYPEICVSLETPRLVTDTLVRFTCLIELMGENSFDAKYNVTWVLNDELFGETITKQFVGLPRIEAYIDESSMAGQMGKWLSCLVVPFYHDTEQDHGQIYSRRYRMGISISESAIQLRESDREPYRLYLYNTLPVSCHDKLPECEILFRVRTKGGVAVYQKPITQSNPFETDKCQFSQHRSEWRANESLTFNIARPLYVMATVDEITRQQPRTAEIQIEFIDVPNKTHDSLTFDSMWNGYKMDPVTVYIHDDEPGICHAWGDPHIIYFDGPHDESFIAHDGGIFSYAKGVSFSDFEIQLKHIQRSGNIIAVACAVAVREEAYVFALDACGGTSSGPLKISGKEVSDPAVGIYRKEVHGGVTKYQIRTIGGIVVDVDVYTHGMINLWIRLPAKYTSDTAGVCGNFNKNANDDGVPTDDDGTTEDNSRYMEQFRVNPDDSLFANIDWNTEADEAPLEEFCDCKEGTVSTSDVTCGLKSLTTNEVIDESAWKIARALIPRDIANSIDPSRRKRSSDRKRAKRREDINYNYFPVNITYIPAEDETPPPWGTLGVTLQEARDACYGRIMDQPTFDVCGPVINPSAYSEIIESCLYDIQMTGQLHWASETESIFTSQCERDIIASVPVRDEDDTTSLKELSEKLKLFQDNSCSTNCSLHGECRLGTCVCDEDYFGPDCMTTKDVIPQVLSYLGPAVCDVKDFLCQTVQLRGTDFVESDNFTCEVQITQESGLVEILSTRAEVYTYDVALCQLPDLLEYITSGNPLYAYSVRLSNDGIQFVDGPMEHRIVVDTVCFDCVDTTCAQAPDTCVHQGQCYLPGDQHPHSDGCLVCDPQHNTRSLTNLREQEEAHGVVIGLRGVNFNEIQSSLTDVQEIVVDVLNEFCSNHSQECCFGLSLMPKESPLDADYKTDNVHIACGYPKRESWISTSLLLAVEVSLHQMNDICHVTPGMEAHKVFMDQDTLHIALLDAIPLLEAHFNSSTADIAPATTTTTITTSSSGSYITSTAKPDSSDSPKPVSPWVWVGVGLGSFSTAALIITGVIVVLKKYTFPASARKVNPRDGVKCPVPTVEKKNAV